MAVRQVITGHDDAGKSIFAEDRTVEPVTVAAMPGFETHELWAEDGERAVPRSGGPAKVEKYFPGLNGVVFRYFQIPPATADGPAADFDVEAAFKEVTEKLPGMMEHMEPDNPGMHTTDSVDFIIVLDGEVDLELDDGAEKHLSTGDCVIQNGTRHAWRNRSGRPALMAAILLGAKRGK
jgi:hypothetical protein